MAYGLADATLGAITLKQCSQATLNTALDILVGRGSGNVAPDDHFVNGSNPAATFTSMDVATILAANTANFANAGLQVSSGSLVFPLRIRSAGSTYAGSGAHTTISSANGLIIPRSLSVPGKGAASIDLECLFESTDGRTIPLTTTTNASLSNGSFNAMYRLYPCSVNGSAVAGVSNVTVNFGITVENNGDLDGFIYPTEHYITQTDPTIDITFKDEAAFETYGPLFTAQTAAVINLQKMAAGSTVVDVATEEHITLTFADGIVTVDQIGNSGNTRGEYTIRLYGESLTVSTTAALS